MSESKVIQLPDQQKKEGFFYSDQVFESYHYENVDHLYRLLVSPQDILDNNIEPLPTEVADGDRLITIRPMILFDGKGTANTEYNVTISDGEEETAYKVINSAEGDLLRLFNYHHSTPKKYGQKVTPLKDKAPIVDKVPMSAISVERVEFDESIQDFIALAQKNHTGSKVVEFALTK